MCTYLFIFFNDTATTEIYTLSLHDALPISERVEAGEALRAAMAEVLDRLEGSFAVAAVSANEPERVVAARNQRDRKSTRLNSSHANISYAVFCLKKKKVKTTSTLSVSSKMI